jgi:hypothetical protein
VRSLPVFALPEVEGDLRVAMAHYDSWHPDGGEHIRLKYDETVGWIAWNPETFPKKYGSVRRAILKRAYYIVYFVVERDRSLVIAVLDGRRSPNKIRTIVDERSRTRR